MSVAGKKIGFGLTGSFCTLENSLVQMEKLAFLGADILPIVSYMVKSTDTRFGSAQYFIDKIGKIVLIQLLMLNQLVLLRNLTLW
jgi:dipicolinate synthase subunit B